MRLHVDTDLGSNPDDACALAMLLGWPGVELVGVTTVGDPDGRRAGYVRRVLGLAGRVDVPVVQGAAVSLTDGQQMGELLDHERYWGGRLPRLRSSPGAALDLLRDSVMGGATVVALGPATNLALLNVVRPGLLAEVPVVLMGGWSGQLGDGLPPWGAERDTNVRRDPRAATALVRGAGRLTLVPLAVTTRCHLRAEQLARLGAAGPLGELLARQSALYSGDTEAAALGRRWPALPDDLALFQHDALACAVAVGWPGVRCRPTTVSAAGDAVLRFDSSDGGRPARVAAAVDSDAFIEAWLRAVERVG